jgi:hypothetical protein
MVAARYENGGDAVHTKDVSLHSIAVQIEDLRKAVGTLQSLFLSHLQHHEQHAHGGGPSSAEGYGAPPPSQPQAVQPVFQAVPLPVTYYTPPRGIPSVPLQPPLQAVQTVVERGEEGEEIVTQYRRRDDSAVSIHAAGMGVRFRGAEALRVFLLLAVLFGVGAVGYFIHAAAHPAHEPREPRETGSARETNEPK